LMLRFVLADKRKEIVRIGENPPHFFGVP
jgi:hypothetical protein